MLFSVCLRLRGYALNNTLGYCSAPNFDENYFYGRNTIQRRHKTTNIVENQIYYTGIQ